MSGQAMDQANIRQAFASLGVSQDLVPTMEALVRCLADRKDLTTQMAKLVDRLAGPGDAATHLESLVGVLAEKKDLIAPTSAITKNLSKAPALAAPLSNLVVGLADSYASNKRLLATALPRLDEQDYEALIPQPLHHPMWQREDEQALVQAWAQDPGYVAMSTHAASKQEITLWKSCGLFWQCTPMDIISPEYHLQFDNSEKEEKLPGSEQLSPIWTTRFCEALRVLLPHPLWGGRPLALATAIQYAVICRTNDRRQWPLSNPTGEIFFEVLIEALKKYNGVKAIPDIHQSAQKMMASRHEDLTPSIWSSLFKHLEKLSDWKRESDGPTGDDTPVYRVKTGDLLTIARAVDAAKTTSFPAMLPTAYISSFAETFRNSKDRPIGADVPALRGRLFLSQKRALALAAKETAAAAAEVSVPAADRSIQRDESSSSDLPPDLSTSFEPPMDSDETLPSSSAMDTTDTTKQTAQDGKPGPSAAARESIPKATAPKEAFTIREPPGKRDTMMSLAIAFGLRPDAENGRPMQFMDARSAQLRET